MPRSDSRVHLSVNDIFSACAQAILQAAGRMPHAPNQDGRCLPSPSRGRPLPLPVSDGDMLRRQFYYALAVHERRGQLVRIVASATAERERLLRAARKGALLIVPTQRAAHCVFREPMLRMAWMMSIHACKEGTHEQACSGGPGLRRSVNTCCSTG